MIRFIRKKIKWAILTSAVMPLTTTLSCGVATSDPQPAFHNDHFQVLYNQPAAAFSRDAFGLKLLNPSVYNGAITKAKALYQKHYLIVAVIANNNIYVEFMPFTQTEKVNQLLSDLNNLQFKFYHVGFNLGDWIQTFKVKINQKWSNWKHGSSTSKNYGDFYPMYAINHQYAQLGVSNWTVRAQDFYEITYDHNS